MNNININKSHIYTFTGAVRPKSKQLDTGPGSDTEERFLSPIQRWQAVLETGT